MLCDICHKNIATVHLTEITGNRIVELHLCQECANLKTEELKAQLDLSELLGGLVEKKEIKEKPSISCPKCALTLDEFKKKGRLGCSKCYETFRESLFPLLRKIHGSTHHVGKFPKEVESDILVERKIRELKHRLTRAIKLEEYEEAAKIRDRIKELERRRNRKKV